MNTLSNQSTKQNCQNSSIKIQRKWAPSKSISWPFHSNIHNRRMSTCFVVIWTRRNIFSQPQSQTNQVSILFTSGTKSKRMSKSHFCQMFSIKFLCFPSTNSKSVHQKLFLTMNKSELDGLTLSCRSKNQPLIKSTIDGFVRNYGLKNHQIWFWWSKKYRKMMDSLAL